MITQAQLEELRDIFGAYDDETLRQRVSVSPNTGRGVRVDVDKIGWPEFVGLFPGVDPYAPRKDALVRSAEWNPLSQIHAVPHGRQVDIICTDAMIHRVTIIHGPARAHGATLAVELPPLAALWRPA